MTEKALEAVKSMTRDVTKTREMPGLTKFIQDIRNCVSKEYEQKRVNKEMANIREKIKKKKMDGYHRKKYVAKIMYMFMLGYEVDFGFIEAVNLLSSEKFSEKQIGYLAMGLFLHEQHEMLPLIINSMGTDLSSRSELSNCLALTLIANIGSRETAEQLAPQVQNLLVAQATKTTVKKKAAVCLLHLFRKHRDCVVMQDAQPKFIQLLEATSFGFLTAFMSLVVGLGEVQKEGFEPGVPRVIELVNRVVTNRDVPREYNYYDLLNPWLQIKLLRFLRLFPPPQDPQLRASLIESLRRVLEQSEGMKGTANPNYRNAVHAVMFEAIDLIVFQNIDDTLLQLAAMMLGRFIVAKETNVRYLGLEAMSHLAMVSNETNNMVKAHQETVLQALRDPDISIRRRALDLTYAMCDRGSVEKVVAELLSYSKEAEYDIREELALKIAILAEKYASNYAWYVDVILQLIFISGDFVTDDIWHRVVRIVTNHEDIQDYATKKVFAAVNEPLARESAVQVAAYVLGEFGHLIADNEGSRPLDLFRALHRKFPTVSLQTKALLLTTYAKFLNLYPEEQELIRQITDVLRTHSAYLDAEIQQRSVEYLNLVAKPELMQKVWDVMPPFDEKFDRVPETTVENVITPERSKITESNRRTNANVTGGTTVSAKTANVTGGATVSTKEAAANGAAAAAAPPPVPPVPVAAPPPAPALNLPPPRNLEQFNLLCLINEGVLYRDELLQIGLRSAYQTQFGKLMIYYGNSSQFALTNFQVQFPPHPALLIQAQDPATNLGPGLQMQQALLITCNQEFKDPPYLMLQFVANGAPVQIPLLLPVIATKFMEPLQLNRDEFFSRWKMIAGPPQEHQSIVKLMGKAVEGVPYMEKLLSQGLRLAALSGVDTSEHNVVCAGIFHSASKQVVCLVRLENNAQAGMCRLTIRAFHPQITDVLKTLLVAQLGEVLPQ